MFRPRRARGSIKTSPGSAARRSSASTPKPYVRTGKFVKILGLVVPYRTLGGAWPRAQPSPAPPDRLPDAARVAPMTRCATATPYAPPIDPAAACHRPGFLFGGVPLDTRVRRRRALAVALAALLLPIVAGCAAAPSAAPTQGSTSAPAPVASATRQPERPAFGGSVDYQIDGAPATTEVDVVADGASLSGTAVTTFRAGTHTVKLACATRSGDTWALGGTVEQSTVPGEPVGAWSAVIVKDGSPQQIGLWLSEDASAAKDCKAWLASFDPAGLTLGFEPRGVRGTGAPRLIQRPERVTKSESTSKASSLTPSHSTTAALVASMAERRSFASPTAVRAFSTAASDAAVVRRSNPSRPASTRSRARRVLGRLGRPRRVRASAVSSVVPPR